MATFDSGRQRYSMNFYASHQRPLQRRSYTGRPSRPAEGQLRVKPGPRALTAALPFSPQQRKSTGRRAMSQECHERTHAPQQNSRHSVTSSARARSVDGIQCAENSDRYCTTARQRVRKPRCPNELIRPALAARGVELKKMAPVEITGAESCPGGNHVCRLWRCPPPRLDPTMPTMHDSPLRCLWL